MKKIYIVRICAMLLAVIMMVQPVIMGSAAEIQPRESVYLSAYSVYPSAAGGGPVHFYWDVWGTDYWDLGVKTIEVYESVNNVDWYWVKTYSSDTYPNMIAEGVIYHHSSITYYGIAGRYYKAYVTVWGGNGNYGDSRSFWTSTVKS